MKNSTLQQEIRKIKEQIIKNYQPEKIILYGSVVKGKFTENSDIDMLIVKKTNERRIDRIKKILFSVDYSIPFEPLVYTPYELEERNRLGDSFIQEALREGEVIYERK